MGGPSRSPHSRRRLPVPPGPQPQQKAESRGIPEPRSPPKSPNLSSRPSGTQHGQARGCWAPEGRSVLLLYIGGLLPIKCAFSISSLSPRKTLKALQATSKLQTFLDRLRYIAQAFFRDIRYTILAPDFYLLQNIMWYIPYTTHCSNCKLLLKRRTNKVCGPQNLGAVVRG